MATIQIRNVPDDVHRTYRVRAAAVGQSLQEYLLAELVRGARTRSPAEVVAEVAGEMAADAQGWAAESAARFVAADRDAH